MRPPRKKYVRLTAAQVAAVAARTQPHYVTAGLRQDGADTWDSLAVEFGVSRSSIARAVRKAKKAHGR